MAVVEAENEDIPGGPCIAEMVAARVLNERETGVTPVIHGAVTTGSEWLFLRLDGDSVMFDSRDRSLDDVGKILAYLLAIGSDQGVGVIPPSAPSPAS